MDFCCNMFTTKFKKNKQMSTSGALIEIMIYTIECYAAILKYYTFLSINI